MTHEERKYWHAAFLRLGPPQYDDDGRFRERTREPPREKPERRARTRIELMEGRRRLARELADF